MATLKGGLKAWFEEQLREQREELLAEFEARFASKDELAALRTELVGGAARAPPPVSEKAAPAPSGADDPEAAKGAPDPIPEKASIEVPMAESTWDVSMFLGSTLGCGGSVLVLIMLIVNVACQAIFVLLINKNLVEEPFNDDELQGLRAWRNIIGHDMRFVSDRSQVSLVERVCNEDPTLELATEQMNKVQMINSYMNGNTDGYDEYLQGPTMCIIALCVWTMCTMRELGTVFDLIRAFCRLPGAGGCSSRFVLLANGGLDVQRLGLLRRAWIMIILLARVAVAGFLLWFGLLYLVYTNSIADLILNAMALELVLNVDELIFSAMAPARAVMLIRNSVPLKYYPWICCGVDVKSILAPLFVGGCVVYSVFFALVPAMNRIDTAHAILCKGNTSFGIEYDGLGIVRVRGLRSFRLDDLSTTDSVSTTVSDVNTSWAPANWTFALVAGSESRWMDQADVTRMIDTISDIHVDNLQCTDSLTATAASPNRKQVFQKYLAQELGIPEPESCSEIQQYCYITGNSTHLGLGLTRAVCPVTCGCNSLSSGTLVAPPELGCPNSCLVDTTSGPVKPNGETAQVPCEDSDPSAPAEIRSAAAFQALQELAIVWQTTFSWDLIVEFGKWGCGLVRMLRQQNIDLCYPDSNQILARIFSGNPYEGQLVKLFTFYCPKECNCDGQHISYRLRPPARLCPPSCNCPWNMPEDLPDDNVTLPCTLTGMSATPMVDKRCCNLLQQYEIGRAQQDLRYETVLAHLCHPCRVDVCFRPVWGQQSIADCSGRQIQKL